MRRAPMPARGGIAYGAGEILISVVNLTEVDDLAQVYGPEDSFTKELRAAAAEAFGDRED